MNRGPVDSYFTDGCGRCDHYRTPQCKVQRFAAPLAALRKLVQATGLTEQLKWGQPCYSLDGKNLVLISAFQDACALNFFEGAALTDPTGVLEAPGPNSRSARYLKVRTAADVKARKADIVRLLDETIALARAGGAPKPAPARTAMPDELAQRLAADAGLRKAWAALTPGRQRSHLLHIGAAKQAETRARRVERCADDIRVGRGWNER